eukprot:gene43962-58612_t
MSSSMKLNKPQSQGAYLRRPCIPGGHSKIDRPDSIFQQDNDPKHTARSIRTYLENYEVPTLPWPSQSPDLNPIENLWSILDLKVKDRKPSNEDALFEVLKEAWQNLEPDLLTKLADSMPDRI